jgi:hypothetical protein
VVRCFSINARSLLALNVQSNRPGVRELKIIMNKFAPENERPISVSYLHIHLDTRAQFIIQLIILLFGAREAFSLMNCPLIRARALAKLISRTTMRFVAP